MCLSHASVWNLIKLESLFEWILLEFCILSFNSVNFSLWLLKLLFGYFCIWPAFSYSKHGINVFSLLKMNYVNYHMALWTLRSGHFLISGLLEVVTRSVTYSYSLHLKWWRRLVPVLLYFTFSCQQCGWTFFVTRFSDVTFQVRSFWMLGHLHAFFSFSLLRVDFYFLLCWNIWPVLSALWRIHLYMR